MARPLKKEAPRVIESENDRNSEVCSEMPEAPPSEAVRGSLKALLCDIEMIIDVVNDLKRDDFSEKLVAIPQVAISVMLRPFCWAPEKPSESERDLKRDVCSRRPDPETSDAAKVFARPLTCEAA